MDAQRIDSLPNLPARPLDGNKGTFGSVGIVGGCARVANEDTLDDRLADALPAVMLGAPALAAMGAIRAGCGLVKIAAPTPIIEAVLTLAPFATGFGIEVDEHRAMIPSQAAAITDELVRTTNALVVGPGLGSGPEIDRLMARLITQEDTPMIVDADALNALSRIPDFAGDVRSAMILTPHPGEARRLMDALNLKSNPDGNDSERAKACIALAQRIGCIVVLKGKGTVVSDGHRVWTCSCGHLAMGVGGTGDVLSGVIGSLIAQLRANPVAHQAIDLFTASAIGVQAHAMAGEQWADQHHASGGMIASELADECVPAIESLRAKN
tara:strand:- start:1123 stop:2097 length:975 start_codon:yes stop_codon:yes gene_type:complete